MARTSTSLSSGAPSSVANHKVLASLPFFETYIEPIFKLLNISLVQVCSSRFCLQPRVRGKFERCVPPSLLRSRLRDEVNNPQSSSTQWIPLYFLFAQLPTLRVNMAVYRQCLCPIKSICTCCFLQDLLWRSLFPYHCHFPGLHPL